MTTLREMIDKVLTRLRMETSTATQIYSEDAIQMGIQHKFDVLFDQFWMPQFMTYQEQYTLDGTTGCIVGDLSAKVKRWQDLLMVHNQFSIYPLPMAMNNLRHGDINMPVVQPNKDKTKVFRIIPANSVGPVWLTYRTKPANFENDDDVIDMDDQMIILGTCYDMLEDDSTNPGASDKFKNMFDARVKQWQKSQYNMPMSTSPSQTLPLNRWA